MSVEVVNFRLSYRGKPVGTHVIKTEVAGKVRRMESRASLQGPLGNAVITQRSRSSAQYHHSLRFREESQAREGKHVYDVHFDAQTGLVHASTGTKDVATTPYIRPYRDPLSLLGQVRALAGSSAAGIAMLGHDVTVQFAGEVDLSTALGEKRAWAYVLQPGGSVVYVDVAGDNAILKMTQRLAEGHLDSLVVSVSREATMESFGEDQRGGGKRSASRRRGRRRPRRRKRG